MQPEPEESLPYDDHNLADHYDNRQSTDNHAVTYDDRPGHDYVVVRRDDYDKLRAVVNVDHAHGDHVLYDAARNLVNHVEHDDAAADRQLSQRR